MAGAHVHTFEVKVNGSPLPDDVAPALARLVVDDALHIPDTFRLEFRDPIHSVLAKARFKIGTPVEISHQGGQSSAPVPLLKGEVTGLAVEADARGTLTIVTGLDKSHRLFRGRKTQTFLNMSYSNIASKLAQEAGLAAGLIETTNEVHPYVMQGNISDWEFLQSLARKVGYVVMVSDAKLSFCTPTKASTGPTPGSLTAANTPLQLVMGENLIAVSTGVSAAEQVKAVEVRGWNIKTKSVVVGKANATTAAVAIGTTPAQWVGGFAPPDLVQTDIPYRTQSSADKAAKALAESVTSRFASLSGMARGAPELRAGAAVSVAGVGEPFEGKYTLSHTAHVYDEDGYTVEFSATGDLHDGLLSRTSAGSGDLGGRIAGVVPAIVTNNKDPDKLGRVKVKFPWLTEAHESDWARVAQSGGGAGRGWLILPEVNDEVLVAFDQGHLEHPVVIGGLANGKDAPPGDPAKLVGGDGKVDVRGFYSRTGHKLVFDESQDKKAITLITADGKVQLNLTQGPPQSITIDGATGDITITTKGNVAISADAGAKVTSKGAIAVEATGNLDLKGTRVTVDGKAGVEIKGGPRVKVTGAIIQLN